MANVSPTHDHEEEFRQYAKSVRPGRSLAKNLMRAFLLGGLICELGQVVNWLFTLTGMTTKAASTPTVVVMIGLGALLTGLGWYDWLVQWAGMGATLPITGFANAMVAPAMDARSEGLVSGVGAKLFTIAGPVLAYGLAAAFVMGAVRYLWGIAI